MRKRPVELTLDLVGAQVDDLDSLVIRVREVVAAQGGRVRRAERVLRVAGRADHHADRPGAHPGEREGLPVRGRVEPAPERRDGRACRRCDGEKNDGEREDDGVRPRNEGSPAHESLDRGRPARLTAPRPGGHERAPRSVERKAGGC